MAAEIIIAGYAVTITASHALQFLATGFSMATHWLMGSKVIAGPVVGIVASLLWTALILHDRLWGMAPVNACMLVIHTRNLVRWLRESRAAAPSAGWPTQAVADAYGGDDATEIAARTGCIGCPLASRDLALDTVLRSRRWAYLAPLKRLKPLYRELRRPRWRLKKTGLNADGTVAQAKNKQRMGPLTFDARLMALGSVLGIQADCNEAADRLDRPRIDILNAEEEARIRELIAAGTWPQGWDGSEPTADIPMDHIFADGSVQPLLVR